MPTYVYKFVDTGETIEIQQSFSDATLTEAVHPASGEAMAVKKVFQPVGVTFKGDGFYKTDSRTSKGSKSSSSPESSNGSPKSEAAKSDTPKSDTPKTETAKAASASSSTSSSTSSSSD